MSRKCPGGRAEGDRGVKIGSGVPEAEGRQRMAQKHYLNDTGQELKKKKKQTKNKNDRFKTLYEF